MDIVTARKLGSTDVLVVPLYEGDKAGGKLSTVDRVVGLSDALERGEVSGKRFETAWLTGDGDVRNVLVVGAGKRSEEIGPVYGAAARAVRTRYASVSLLLRSDADAGAAVEAFVAGDYEPDLHRSERSASKVSSLTVVGAGDVRRACERASAVADATTLARDLVNEPPNEITPTALAERAVAALEPAGVKVKVLKGNQLRRFGGLLGVARGSDEPPVLISMSWEPSRGRKAPVLGLVGKGVTFDSGGLSLKPSEGMSWMKGDMAGGAAVIGAMRAIAELNVPLQVRAVVPATENMPSGKAVRVGDVLKLYNGKTAEIMNTDAEGRLILADALAWLAEQGATHIVDAATLTGAVLVALGDCTIGVMGRPEVWVNRVLRAARDAGERAWPLPLYPEYREQLRSDVADMRNIGGRNAGTITAAWFLAEAVPDGVEWAHLDIAGTAWGSERKPHRAAGATGSGVGPFVRLAETLAGRK